MTKGTTISVVRKLMGTRYYSIVFHVILISAVGSMFWNDARLEWDHVWI